MVVGAVTIYVAIPLGIWVLWLTTGTAKEDKGSESDEGGRVVRLQSGEAGPDREHHHRAGARSKPKEGRWVAPRHASVAPSRRRSDSGFRSPRNAISGSKRGAFRHIEEEDLEEIENENEPLPELRKGDRGRRPVQLRCSMCQMCYEVPPKLGGRGFHGADSSPAVCPNPACGYIMSGIL